MVVKFLGLISVVGSRTRNNYENHTVSTTENSYFTDRILSYKVSKPKFMEFSDFFRTH
jgi:RAB protein geranylgeranyltransferase component A